MDVPIAREPVIEDTAEGDTLPLSLGYNLIKRRRLEFKSISTGGHKDRQDRQDKSKTKLRPD